MSDNIEPLSSKIDILSDKIDKLYDIIYQENKGLIEIQKRLIQERIGVSTVVTAANIPTITTDKNKINITKFGEDRIKVEGNTYDRRDIIKSCGQAKWENGDKSWSLPLESLDILVEKLQEAGLEKGNEFVINV